MSELRWHPLLEQWVVVTAHRQGRPQMPADWCPFCALPEKYDVYLYPNDFPAFEGYCDVVLYSPEHTKLPSQLPVEQWEKVIGLWTRRTGELQSRTRGQAHHDLRKRRRSRGRHHAASAWTDLRFPVRPSARRKGIGLGRQVGRVLILHHPRERARGGDRA